MFNMALMKSTEKRAANEYVALVPHFINSCGVGADLLPPCGVARPLRYSVPYRFRARALQVGKISRSPPTTTYEMGHLACNYELNPRYLEELIKAGVEPSAFSPNQEVRAIELAGHPFFVATLFQPQLASTPDRPHPLFIGFLKAAVLPIGYIAPQ